MLRAGWIVVAAGLALGCSESNRNPATVRGRVLFQGRPLAGGTVVFTPDPERGPTAPAAHGTIDSQGTFRLSVRQSPYITPGLYRVALADPGTPETWAIFPAALRRPDRSGLEREVRPGIENIFEFHIVLSR